MITLVRYLAPIALMALAWGIVACQRYDICDSSVSDVPGICGRDRDKCDELRYGQIQAGSLFKYNKLTLKEKRIAVRAIREYEGDYIQCLRFLCWMIEQDSDMRVQLLKQWLSIHKKRGDLPELNEVLPCIEDIAYFCSEGSKENQGNRIKEFTEVYLKVHRKVPMLAAELNQTTDLTTSTMTRILMPLMDYDEPFSLTIFSCDMSKLKVSIDSCRRGNRVYTVDSDGSLWAGRLRSKAIYDALIILEKMCMSR